ncbi:MAG TPA: SDR family oxidoreductase [Acidimicrobiales bacterium]|nr:SDR family oxidoreductase [Acidimicrobiales bacterium]
MSALRVLFVGGTGKISSACAQLAVEQGIDLTVLNRGTTASRPLPQGVRSLTADVRDEDSVRAALDGQEFDAVADFIAFTPDQVETDIKLFRDRVGQYLFISSASAYAKPVTSLPIRESTPLRNPYWQYSRDKIACEDRLVAEYRGSGFPITIVRPSHTYDRTSMVTTGGWTDVDRMRRGVPVVVHGDGTSLWALTHHVDFARAFVPMLGNPQAIGEAVHITTEQSLTWDQIYTILGRAAGAEPDLVHVSSEQIARVVPEWGPNLLGDKAHCVVFDNTKARELAPGWVATIPWTQGAREVIEWFDADPARQKVDPQVDAYFDQLVAAAR